MSQYAYTVFQELTSPQRFYVARMQQTRKMPLQVGIVGLPNVGKSTIFTALTRTTAEAANYPFCTIDPNVGVVPVPDPRLTWLAQLYQPQKVTPTTIEFVDIAGLVRGASQGEGLGNQFLSHIREVDAILHVVRCFDSTDITHVYEKVDPLRDIQIVETELLLKDLETLERRKETVVKRMRALEKDAKEEFALLERLIAHLSEGHLARSFDRSEAEARWMRQYFLLTDKPILYVANTDEEGFRQSNQWIEQVQRWAEQRQAEVVTICAALEAELAQLSDEERQEFLREFGITEPALHRVIRKAYELLGLITFFTVGPREVRAWTVRRGATAPEAAGKIHSDFERGFIRAEVMHFADLEALGSEQAVREAGRYRIEGKDYRVQDGDILYIRFNVS